jgi:hypothetical protein
MGSIRRLGSVINTGGVSESQGEAVAGDGAEGHLRRAKALSLQANLPRKWGIF